MQRNDAESRAAIQQMLEDSTHWPLTHGVLGGVAVSSLDLRRVLAAGAAGQRRLGAPSRWALRWMVRFRMLGENARQWGRKGAGKAATAPAACAEGQTTKA
jgi:hypothetical protein